MPAARPDVLHVKYDLIIPTTICSRYYGGERGLEQLNNLPKIIGDKWQSQGLKINSSCFITLPPSNFYFTKGD